MNGKAIPVAMVIGEGSLPAACADTLARAGFEVAAVCSPDAPLRDWAAQRGIPHFDDARSFSAGTGATPHDYLFSIVNFEVLPREVLCRPRLLAINYHDGPLPRYSGLYSTSWAILNGETSHGVAWHVMVDQVDAGDILEQVAVPIGATETAFTLNYACFVKGARSFARLVRGLVDGTVTRSPQDLSQRTYYGLKHWPPAVREDWTPEQRETHRRATDFGPNPIPRPRSHRAPRAD